MVAQGLIETTATVKHFERLAKRWIYWRKFQWRRCLMTQFLTDHFNKLFKILTRTTSIFPPMSRQIIDYRLNLGGDIGPTLLEDGCHSSICQDSPYSPIVEAPWSAVSWSRPIGEWANQCCSGGGDPPTIMLKSHYKALQMYVNTSVMLFRCRPLHICHWKRDTLRIRTLCSDGNIGHFRTCLRACQQSSKYRQCGNGFSQTYQK